MFMRNRGGWRTGRWYVLIILALWHVACEQTVTTADNPAAAAPEFNAINLYGARFGQTFSVADSAGNVRQLSDFSGKIVMLFFGYSHCPDICPLTLARANEIVRQYPDGEIQVLFMTVDPQRDQPALLERYVTRFNPQFIALRPTAEQLPQLITDFRIFVSKVYEPGASGDDYSVDHTALTYIYDRQGQLRLAANHNIETTALLADLKQLDGR